jgi:hydroxymethylpyrimidine kinase/phosphomethylpyrimidine kinase
VTTASSTVCLTIAGLDPSGGAGVVADVKTFSAFGCFAAAVITSITFQNTTGVFGAVHQSAGTVRHQIEPVFADLKVSAVKTGMLPTEEIIRTTVELLKINNVKNLVVDPVVRSTSGFDLIDDNALKALVTELFPFSTLVTPNIPEAERIAKMPIKNEGDAAKAAAIIQEHGARNVLIKGGHFDRRQAIDHLFIGSDGEIYQTERIDTTATHGTGCTLSSAIAANLALGRDLKDAVGIAKRYVTEAIRSAPNIGKGNSPINQLIHIR